MWVFIYHIICLDMDYSKADCLNLRGLVPPYEILEIDSQSSSLDSLRGTACWRFHKKPWSRKAQKINAWRWCPNFKISVFSDQCSESLVTWDSDVMDNEPAPVVEEEDNETRKNKKDAGAGFHMLSGQESSPMNPLQIWLLGNIAVGSSWGDAALKQQDRAGPTALVGVGTTVTLKRGSSGDNTHKFQRSPKAYSATVASGAGDHMSTTMPANTCALPIDLRLHRRRLYDSTSIKWSPEKTEKWI